MCNHCKPNTLRRFYGNPILGDWLIGDDEVIGCFQLQARQAEFEWKETEHTAGVALWPHKNGIPLVYDESA